MLYTQKLTIKNGRTSSGMFGGSPQDEDNPLFQVGFQRRPRTGVVRVDSTTDDQRIFDVTFNVLGYQNKPVSTCRAPGRAIIELPCTVEIFGPDEVEVLIEAWELIAFPDRGAARSFLSPVEESTPVPTWASSVDIAEPAIVTFRNNAAVIVGEVAGPVVNFSLPSGAATFTVASSTANRLIVFRQQG